MRKPIAIAAALLFAGATLVESSHGQANAVRIFRSAEVVNASGVQIPPNSVANGIVELYLTIGEAGNIEDVRLTRPLASVTEETVRSIKTWTFAPATMRGKPIESRITVMVVFCPAYGFGASEIPLPPVSPESAKDAADSPLPPVSPEIVTAKYPLDSGARSTGGTVVIRLLVGAEGQPGLIRVIHGNQPLVDEARLAVKDWKFTPAGLNSKPVTSGIILAFAFRAPVSNP